MDADLKDFFGSVDHKKLLTLVAQRVADGRVLRLIQQGERGELMWKHENYVPLCRAFLAQRRGDKD